MDGEQYGSGGDQAAVQAAGRVARGQVFFDPANDALIWEGEPIDGSFKLGGEFKQYNAARCTIATIRRLATLGLRVSSTTGYDWPIRPSWRPRDHQRCMVDFLLDHPRCFNLSDMGTQKTLAALWAADRIMVDQPGHRCLIVCPLSTMELIWADAIRYDFLGRRSFQVLHGTSAQRTRALAKEADFYIVNHDGLAIGAVSEKHKFKATGFTRAIQERTDIQIIIYDEASALKKATTRRSRVARGLFRDKAVVWALTATPAPQAPSQAFGIAKFVFPDMRQSFSGFRDTVEYQPAGLRFKWVPRSRAAEEVAKLLQPAIRFSLEECTDLPPCTVQQHQVELSDEQKKALNELKQDLQITLASGKEITAINEAAYRTKLIQIACGAVYDAGHAVHQLDCKPRLRVLEEVIEQCGQKIIIFAPFTSVVHMLYEHLRKNHSIAMITGSTSPNERARTFRGFQSGLDPQVIVADAGTMSHGLDLTRASVICWYAPIDKAETYQQANARIHRPGQIYPTTIVQLASTKLEREIFECRAKNISMQGKVLMLLEG